MCQGRGCCTASSRVAAALAVAAEACELIAREFLHGLAGCTAAGVVAGSWSVAAAPAVTAEACELIARKFLQGLACAAPAGVVAVVRKRGEGRRRHWWRCFTTAAVEHFLCDLYRHSSSGGLNKQIDGAARRRRRGAGRADRAVYARHIRLKEANRARIHV